MLSLDAERSLASRLASTKTLVLNADYRPLSYSPLSTMGWEDAVAWKVRIRQNRIGSSNLPLSATIRFRGVATRRGPNCDDGS